MQKKLEEYVKDKKCPNWFSVIIKKSGYGSFGACPGYPKCKYILPVAKDDDKEEK